MHQPTAALPVTSSSLPGKARGSPVPRLFRSTIPKRPASIIRYAGFTSGMETSTTKS